MFIGRKNEFKQLELVFKNSFYSSQLVKVDGRRRVGKTTIVENFMLSKSSNPDIFYLKFIGNNHFSSSENLNYCINSLSYQLSDILNNLKIKQQEELNNVEKYQLLQQDILKTIQDVKLNKISTIKSWIHFLNILDKFITIFLKNKFKLFIFFDEVAWYDKKSSFINSFSNQWNLYWANNDRYTGLIIFMATSVSSWFKQKVEKMDSFYNRFTASLSIKPFTIQEILDYCRYINPNIRKLDVIRYYLIFGGIITYYNWIDLHNDYESNLNLLHQNSEHLKMEKNKLFDGLFGVLDKDSGLYQNILKILCKSKSKDFKFIYSELLKNKDNHNLDQRYIRLILDNLVDSNLLSISQQKDKKQNSVYMITDPFLFFMYYWFENNANSSFLQLDQNYSTWKGSAFEICLIANKHLFADVLGTDSQLSNLQIMLNWMSNKELSANRKNKQPIYHSQVDILIKKRSKLNKYGIYYIVEAKCYDTTMFILDSIELNKILNRYSKVKFKLADDYHLLNNGNLDTLLPINIVVFVIDKYSIAIEQSELNQLPFNIQFASLTDILD